MAKFNVGDIVETLFGMTIWGFDAKNELELERYHRGTVVFLEKDINGGFGYVVDFGGFHYMFLGHQLQLVEKGNPTPSDAAASERVNHPSHYQHPSGVECITVARHHNFDIGNALKYLWRAGLKQEEGLSSKAKEIEDLQKAAWYINDWIEKLKGDDESV